MPSQFPPYSTARHSAIEAKRQSRSPRGRENRDSRYRNQPYVEEQRRGGHKMRALRGHLVAMIGEFVGTTMFLWFALAGTQSANSFSNDELQKSFYISLAFGMSLLICAWAFYRISGGLFNPAVTVGMVAAGQMPFIRALFVFPSQLLGGIAGAALVSCMLPGSIQLTVTTLGEGTSITRGVFIEAFMTFILVFVILMLAAEKNNARAVAPVGIGLTLFAAMLAGTPYTGGSLNPARSLGPSVVAPYFPGYHYIYWFGPFMGALAAAGYHRLNKVLHYEDAQPGQDSPHGTDGRRHRQAPVEGPY